MTIAAPLQTAPAKPRPSTLLASSRLLQRKCACGASTSALDEKCDECKSRALQKKLAIGASNDPLELEADRVAEQVMAEPAHSPVRGTPPYIQRYTAQQSEAVEVAPASVDRVLASPGRPLEPALRKDMEQHFGYDFSQVRVHSDTSAEQSAREVNASAYAAGHHLVFGTGRFAPSSHEGRRLIVHELAHVVQQSSTYEGVVGQLDQKLGLTLSAAPAAQPAGEENENDRHRISVGAESPGLIRRQPDRDVPPPPAAYPHFSQILLGDVSDKIGELEMTCDDRRERGFFIFWDERRKVAYPGETIVGEAPKGCELAKIQLPPMPPDHGNVLVAGWFHNHPPQPPECASKMLLGEGPSERDMKTSAELKLPGLVHTFIRSGPNTTCNGNPRATFFFGPARRWI